MQSQRFTAEIKCKGHASLTADAGRALKVELRDEWKNDSSAIGYRAECDYSQLRSLRGRVLVTIRCDTIEESLEATISPDFVYGSSLVFRKSQLLSRCFAFATTKAAGELSSELRSRMKTPDAFISLTISERGSHLEDSAALYIVALPIGNHADLAPRAVEVLRGADIILAEDTRVALRTLSWYGISTPVRSCHDHTETSRAEELLSWLKVGKRVAFVSDAGTPSIADPGFRLVCAAARAGRFVTAVPGPTACIAALVVSALAPTSFRFAGFPPRKPGARREFIDRVSDDPGTTIIYEAPHRLLDLLADCARIMPERSMAICNDLTKETEQTSRGSARELYNKMAAEAAISGEFVIVVGPSPHQATMSNLQIMRVVASLLHEQCTPSQIAKSLARAGLASRNEVYAMIRHLQPMD